MSKFWSPLVTELSPYVPGEQPQIEQLTKLNTNELPWPPSPRVLEAVRNVQAESLRLYPDPDNSALRDAWAAQLGLSASQVFIGNGSDEVLAHTFRALFNPAKPVLFPDITYSFYPVYCGLYQLAFETIALDDNFQLLAADYSRDNGGVIFPNPNAPTGIGVDLDFVVEILKANPDSVVVVDEAYVDFGAQSAVSLIDSYENLLVVQTLSKSRGLAGLRVGAAFGQSHLIEGLARVKNSFNSYPLDRVAEVAAIAALEDESWFEDSCTRLIANRQRMENGLMDLGFDVLPSTANFIMARHAERNAEDLFMGLREKKVLVRYFSAPRIDQFLRISVGTSEECELLLSSLSALLDA